MKKYLQTLIKGENLSFHEMKEAAEKIFTNQASDSEIAALLLGLSAKGETADEIAGLVEGLRKHAVRFPASFGDVMDNCGTGGDGSQSFNISTASAFVLAGAGVKIAKHGNRSVSSKTGSADVLEHLGVALDFTVHEVEELLRGNGVAFLFAPHVHPKLKQIMKVRKELKIPTIFNLIGPLTNPVELETQLLGIYRRDKLEMMATALHKLGRRRAIVVNGAGYMDEASLAGENHVVLLERGELIQFTIHPHEVGLNEYPLEAIRGGDAEVNADILKRVLHGEKGAYTETVVLNSGLALFANGRAKTVQEGVQIAMESIQSGAAREKLQYLIDYSSIRNRKVAQS